jgi:hypothetical protein
MWHEWETKRNTYMILVGKRNGKLMLENILKVALARTGQAWTGFIWLMIGTSRGLK